MKPIHIYVFDAYGTLFDVHSAVARHRDAVGPQADRLSEIWRQKQLEYTWVRSLMGAYQGFDALTEQSLDFAAARCGGISAATRILLLDAYQTLDAFADVVPTLQKLKAKGCITAILSNGTPSMLASAVRSAGLTEWLDVSLSVDAAKLFKTAPQAYELVEKSLNVSPGEISFQSSNRWDIAGARRHGFQTAWINRSHAPDEYPDFAPDRILSGLAGLAD
ncbi:MAG: haloacid dehalogenase type II [Hyphomicrobiales bacterium]|nr:haloacid dehalogenase type II [Hyphomicrobiales bacterium]MDE2114512.1 haloacid dehalogenase type II [Hyphomicrobiales bacterium]